MLFVSYWVVLILFWYYIFRIATRYGYKVPVIVALLWYAAFSGNFFFGIIGPMLFITVEAILCFLLISFDLYKSKQKTITPPTPLDNSEESHQI